MPDLHPGSSGMEWIQDGEPHGGGRKRPQPASGDSHSTEAGGGTAESMTRNQKPDSPRHFMASITTTHPSDGFEVELRCEVTNPAGFNSSVVADSFPDAPLSAALRAAQQAGNVDTEGRQQQVPASRFSREQPQAATAPEDSLDETGNPVNVAM